MLFISEGPKDWVKQAKLLSNKCQEESSLWLDGLAFWDIDTNHLDPQMCNTNAADICMHLRIAEVKRRVAIGWGAGWGCPSGIGMAWHASNMLAVGWKESDGLAMN